MAVCLICDSTSRRTLTLTALSKVQFRKLSRTRFSLIFGAAQCRPPTRLSFGFGSTRPTFGQFVKELYCLAFLLQRSGPCLPHAVFMPNVFVDISGFSEQKYTAMEAYATELRTYPHPRSIEYLRQTDVAEGLKVGLPIAESLMLLRRITD